MAEVVINHVCPHCERVFDSPSWCVEGGVETEPRPMLRPTTSQDLERRAAPFQNLGPITMPIAHHTSRIRERLRELLLTIDRPTEAQGKIVDAMVDELIELEKRT